jgi:hypothetical protein
VATTYIARADTGCTCGDATCLEAAHGALCRDGRRRRRPRRCAPSIHTAHGTFGKCWREGTLDMRRDFTHVAETICT